MLTRRHVALPSRVSHRPGPQAQPSREVANRIALTALPAEPGWPENGAGGAGAATQVRPPSAVLRSSTVWHGCTLCAHGGTASSHPTHAETKLAETAESLLLPPASTSRPVAAACHATPTDP